MNADEESSIEKRKNLKEEPESRQRAKRRRVIVSRSPISEDDTAEVAFSKRLRQLMDAKGWRQADLAREATKFLPKGASGISRQIVGTWYHGKHIPVDANATAVAAALGVTIEELIPPGAAYIVGSKEHMQKDPVSVTFANGMARLRIDMLLPQEVAIEIVKLTQSSR